VQLKEFWAQIFGETFFQRKKIPFTYLNQKFHHIQAMQKTINLILGKLQ